MRIKILSILGFFILFTACKSDKQNETITETTNNKSVTNQDDKNLNYIEYVLDPKAKNYVKDWKEYYTLQELIVKLKKNNFSFFTDNENATANTFKTINTNIPLELKSPAISARVLVIETKLYKLESLANLTSTSKEELTQTNKELLIACSNLNLQINKKAEFASINIKKPGVPEEQE